MVECDTGRKRAGVETPAEAIALANEIAASPGLPFAGFMLYPTETGWAEAQKFYDEALAGVRALWARSDDRLDRRLAEPEERRQAQGRDRASPGTYIYNDRMQVAAGVADMGRLRAQRLFHRGQPRRARIAASSMPAPRR